MQNFVIEYYCFFQVGLFLKVGDRLENLLLFFFVFGLCWMYFIIRWILIIVSMVQSNMKLVMVISKLDICSELIFRKVGNIFLIIQGCWLYFVISYFSFVVIQGNGSDQNVICSSQCGGWWCIEQRQKVVLNRRMK